MQGRWAIVGGVPLLAVALVLSAAGCRGGASQELLERELRVQEDRIYQLEDEVQTLLAENDALKHFADSGMTVTSPSTVITSPSTITSPSIRQGIDGRSTLPPVRSSPSTSPAIEFEPPKIELPPASKTPQSGGNTIPPESVPHFQGPPAIVTPGADFPEGELPRTTGPRPNSTTPARPVSTPVAPTSGPSVSAPLNAARSEDVISIALNDKVTAGYNDDSRPGDDGIRIVVEPRSAAGVILPAASRISVVAMDPLVNGAASRVARWDFSAEQVANSYDKTPSSEGLHLELPWIDAVPQHRELHLFVRYYTADGRKLDVDRTVDVALRAPEERRPSHRPPTSTMPTKHPQTTQRSPYRHLGPPPTARLLPPEFQPTQAKPLTPKANEPTLAPPREIKNSVAPVSPTDESKRTGARWAPYR